MVSPVVNFVFHECSGSESFVADFEEEECLQPTHLVQLLQSNFFRSPAWFVGQAIAHASFFRGALAGIDQQ